MKNILGDDIYFKKGVKWYFVTRFGKKPKTGIAWKDKGEYWEFKVKGDRGVWLGFPNIEAAQ